MEIEALPLPRRGEDLPASLSHFAVASPVWWDETSQSRR